MKTAVRLLIYGSLIALLIYLYNIDFIALESIDFNYTFLSLSFIFLVLGFLLSAVSWKVSLKIHGVSISSKLALISHGLPVFTKYIPGRIWTILGRAALVKSKEHNIKTLAFISLKEQLIYLSLGFIISIYPILKTERIKEYSLIIISISFILFLLLFSRNLQRQFQKLWQQIFKQELSFPLIKAQEFFKLSLFVLIYWLVWTIGFYFLLLSVIEVVPVYFAFVFPLSISLGLISIIFPGGLGVREGVIVLFLVSNGVQAEIAVTFSVFSRLWFLAGEILIFLTAYILNRRS